MPKIKRRTTKGDVARTILNVIKYSGLLSVALVAPNSIQAFKKLGIISHKRQKEVINRTRDRLLKEGSLEKDARGFLRLTETGEEKLAAYARSDYQLLVPRIWDKRWRVLIFDIPEEKKKLRDKVRGSLISIGFQRVQDSVWVFPYDCEELVTLLKTDFKIGKDLLYLIVEKIENDLELRNWFNL